MEQVEIDEIEARLALAVAKKDFKPVKRSRTGQIQNRTYSYADISDIIEAVEEALREQGILLTQPLDIQYQATHQHLWGVVTRLVHLKTGYEWRSFHPIFNAEAMTPQQIGSAITYARRYSISALLGIVTEEDDDGAAASEKQEEMLRGRPQPRIQTATQAAVRNLGDAAFTPPAAKPGTPACPKCGNTKNVIKSRYEDADFVCYAKNGGCGHKWFVQGSAKNPTPPTQESPKATEAQITEIKAAAKAIGIDGIAKLQGHLRAAAPNAPTDSRGLILMHVLTQGEAAILIESLKALAEERPAAEPQEEVPF